MKEIQVFDKQGQPRPSYLQSEYGGSDAQQMQIMIPGRPQPPLSIAILIDAASTRVQIPVELTDLPLTQQTQEEGE